MHYLDQKQLDENILKLVIFLYELKYRQERQTSTI